MRRLGWLLMIVVTLGLGLVAQDYFKIGRAPVPQPGSGTEPPVAMLPPQDAPASKPIAPVLRPPVPIPPQITPPVPMPKKADRVVIDKGERKMTLYAGDTPFRTYKIALGGNPIGHKQREGDRRTPEGSYKINFANEKSAYHLSLRISYPSAEDKALARKRGVNPGSDIMIHGLPNGFGAIGAAHTNRDWTDGCIAVTNEEMNEVWRLVAVGTPIEINP